MRFPFASSFEIGTPGWSPGFPSLDGVHLVFDEGPDSGGARTVHIEQLSQDEVQVGADHVVSYSAHPLARAFIGSTPPGKLVGWAEDGDATLSDDTPGRSRLVLQVLDADLQLGAMPVEVAVTRFGSMGQPAVVPLEYPRGVLVAWSGRSRTSPQRAIFAQFLLCAE